MDPIDVTYHDVEKLVHSLLHKYHRKHGGDYNSLLSEAALWFMNAYATFDRNKKTSFSTWVFIKVSMGLRTLTRQQIRLSKKEEGLIRLDINLLPPKSKKSNFHLGRFYQSLSKDAKSVVRLVIATPLDIKGDLLIRGRETPHTWRLAIWKYLKLIGWKKERIRAAFSEIQTILFSKGISDAYDQAL